MTDPAECGRAVVRVRGLERRFGTVAAVARLSFDVLAGQVLGFIGANGAGKTTTMRLMATLDLPDAGSVEVCGFDAVNQPFEVRRLLGFMPDSYGTYRNVTVWEYLDFFARACRFAGRERRERVAEVIEFTDLQELTEREMTALSKGMLQRLCLARALLPDPRVLVLDEPAAGLDPRARLEFKHLVRLLAADGKALFISSHILAELEEMCDALLFIDRGSVVHHGSTESLKRGAEVGAVVTVRVAGDTEPLREWALLSPGVALDGEVKDGYRLRFEGSGAEDLAQGLQAIVQAGVRVTEFHREQRRLDEAFVDVLKRLGEGDGDDDGRGAA